MVSSASPSAVSSAMAASVSSRMPAGLSAARLSALPTSSGRREIALGTLRDDQSP
jgi:hypothetical protein